MARPECNTPGCITPATWWIKRYVFDGARGCTYPHLSHHCDRHAEMIICVVPSAMVERIRL